VIVGTLNVRNLLKNRKLSKSIANLPQKLEHKAKAQGMTEM